MNPKQKYKIKHKAQGLCYYCAEPALPHYRYPILTHRCAYHTIMNQKYNKEQYARRREEIKKRTKERIQKNIESGLCRCGNIKDEDMDSGKKGCHACRTKTLKRG